ncbi:hypothetical protein [Haladaptatus salinisoli]|uniref:hypothetical protein n=1 Tax=Haladaptatus salinisoli TaxID=2884876 RepID=UPI001D0A4DD9|nr:hypothetical protein [Haladaptatus salinisoli]
MRRRRLLTLLGAATGGGCHSIVGASPPDANPGRRDTPNLTVWRTSNPSERCETTATTAEASTE